MEAAAAAARSSLPALSHKLMEQFSFAASGGNLVFSPLSIYCALSQIATSARGSTLRELLDVVGVSCSKELAQNASFMVHRSLYGGPQYGGPLVTYGSALWHDTTLTPKPAYRQAAYSLKGGVGAVDFLSKVSHPSP
jgi:serpin B